MKKENPDTDIKISSSPKRIVSLVPSQTELLHALGLNEEVVGITKFCVHPNEWFRAKPRVRGTKSVDIAAVKALRPDLVIANKEENVKEQVEELKKIAPVWVSDIQTLEDALEMIRTIGSMVDKQQKANELVNLVKEEFDNMNLLRSKLRVAYLIWKDPYMAAGGDTFINDLLQRCGFVNVFKHLFRYPEITIEQLASVDSQMLLLSSEPYPFKDKHLPELQSKLPDCKILIVDGEMFSWYGSRLLHAASYFKQLLAQIGPNPLHLIP